MESVLRKHRSALLEGLLVFAAVSGAAPLLAGPPAAVQTLIEQRCVGCHEGPGGEGGLDLTTLGSPVGSQSDLAHWMRIIDRVAAGEMPPADSDPLTAEEREAFASEAGAWVERQQEAAWSRTGRVRGRRLTNFQLERTLHDLLGIDIPLADKLPDEPRTSGFTTVSSGQPMSHFQVQAHLDIVDIALDEAFRRATTPADEWSRQLPPSQLCRQDPSRRCREPELIDNAAVTWNGNVIYYGRLPATRADEPGWYRFTVRASALNVPKDHGVWCSVRTGLCVSSAPLLAWAAGFEATEEQQEWTFETWLPEGHMLEIRPGDATLKVARFEGGQIGTGEGAPQQVPGVAVHGIVMERIHRGGSDDDLRRMLFDRTGELAPDAATLGQTDPRGELARLIHRFAERAFRRPVDAADIAPYVSLAEAKREATGLFLEALRSGYRALLCSPRFVYLQESAGPLDDYAVASRLSYFLTSSMPDEALLAAASRGRLRDPAVIRREVHRLLAGERGRRFVEDFSGEWLDLALIDATQPDRRLFRDYDQIVQQAMLEETHASLEQMLRDDLDIRRLIQSPTTFLNSRLARYYGIEGVAGDAMRPVVLSPSDRRGGGVLTQGAILKVTANGTNTSPVLRGIWVSERLLGVDVPPPPANVPAIEPDIRGATTIREMLEKHRADASCAACHAAFDPPGFALENYDPTGRWRDRYLVVNGGKVSRGAEIDASDSLADGRFFADVEELQQLLAGDPRSVARGVAAKLLTYGTGGPITFADRKDVEKLADSVATDGLGFRSLVAEVAACRLFTMK